MHLLRPAIQKYAWGTRDFIPELLGIEVIGDTYAELWYGAHPAAPSTLLDESPLSSLKSAQNLPYLLKILSIGSPLSIQVHPTKLQAQVGYDREEELGIPISDPNRSYKDPNHKPETIVALHGGLEARAGIRNAGQIHDIMSALGSRALTNLWFSDEVNTRVPNLLEQLFLLSLDYMQTLIAQVMRNQELNEFNAQYPDDAKWLNECSMQYPGDPGILVQLLMNYVRLAPGEGLHMGAGELHAYLRGNGVEIMASSDNVIRAGLTPKKVDLAELLKVTDFTSKPPRIDVPKDGVFHQGLSDYRLTKINADSEPLHISNTPSIVLCISGLTRTQSKMGKELSALPGRAIYNEDANYALTDGQAFVATPGL